MSIVCHSYVAIDAFDARTSGVRFRYRVETTTPNITRFAFTLCTIFQPLARMTHHPGAVPMDLHTAFIVPGTTWHCNASVVGIDCTVVAPTFEAWLTRAPHATVRCMRCFLRALSGIFDTKHSIARVVRVCGAIPCPTSVSLFAFAPNAAV